MIVNYKLIFLVAAGWAAISQLLFYYGHTYLVSQVPASVLSTVEYEPVYIQLAYALTSFIAGIYFGYVIALRKPKSRTFVAGILRVTLVYLGSFIAVVIIGTSIITLIAGGTAGMSFLIQNIKGVLFNQAVLMSLLIWGFILAGTYFIFQVGDMLGRGVLLSFISGKYFSPSEEERIFMFMDLRSSTTIAERAGHTMFFSFIRELIEDATLPILNHRGEIYQYVGDEIVISWKMKSGIENANCLKCFLEIRNLLQARSSYYLTKYGSIPEFKAGLHHGLVTVGEIGLVKKDIVFSGDVLNTTSRIQGQCNEFGVDILISGETVSIIKNHVKVQFRLIGTTELRGKEKPMELFTVMD